MGCRLSKDEIQENNTNEMATEHEIKIDYKAQFERKMCLAKETPEPHFDLSNCNLKNIPSGVFVLCRVLRKEILNLSYNKLTTFTGGFLSDLSLLRVLDLSHNNLKKLPDDIFRIENLRELMLSNNQLTKLPSNINTLIYLELLDISCNNLESIDEINCMPRLRILNVSGNNKIRQLPNMLSTCDNLFDLVIDIETIDWPPREVTEAGTQNILKFLTTGESVIMGLEVACEASDYAINNNTREDALMRQLVERQARNNTIENKLKYVPLLNDGYGNENALLEQLQQRQLKQKQELLQAVLMQQNETETLVNKIQQQKDNERDKLIKDILKAEESATLLIEQLLALKSGPDPVLLEKEQREEERLLEKLHLKHSDLRKQEILATMIEVLKDEDNKIQDYQQKRNISSHDILEREEENSRHLKNFFQNYEKNRNEIIEKICEDEELQKQAVVTLIEMNDARTWGLVEQLKIVESQLAGMTQLEIDKKKYSSVEQMNELADKRMRLTYVLMDLLEQQESRKKQLFDTLLSMEAQKRNEEDFWLLQYQRLLDSRPLEFSIKSNSIDPLLGYNFLVNGVIHCLPFLQKLWQNNDICLEKLSAEKLEAAGIRDEKDQKLILKSIEDFIKDNTQRGVIVTPVEPTAPIKADEEPQPKPSVVDTERPPDSETISECVICMEQSVKIIFIPCGHMCCCIDCQQKVDLCPMCRSNIERKIKVLQP